MGGKASRTKGHSFERRIAQELRVVFPQARRLLEYHEDDCRGVDIANTGPFKFQCKKLKAYVSINTINEIQLDPLGDEIPVLITAGDALPAMAVLPFKDLLSLIAAAINGVDDVKA